MKVKYIKTFYKLRLNWLLLMVTMLSISSCERLHRISDRQIAVWFTDNADKFNFSVAQIINEKENKKYHSKSSLDEKLSDVVGATEYKINEKISLNYNFSIDQNYSDFNYNEVSTILNFDPIKIDFDYLKIDKSFIDKIVSVLITRHRSKTNKINIVI